MLIAQEAGVIRVTQFAGSVTCMLHHFGSFFLQFFLLSYLRHSCHLSHQMIFCEEFLKHVDVKENPTASEWPTKMHLQRW